MVESRIAETVVSAGILIDDGDQGDAQALLSQALQTCSPAHDEAEAIAIATATKLLIRLDCEVLPWEVLGDHVDRMRLLTEGFEGADAVTARVEAELGQFEWVHFVEGVDPITLVDVLRTAAEFVAREGGSLYTAVRRSVAEAQYTVQLIREWLNQDAVSIAVALETLALGLTGETDMRMRHIRIEALYGAARLGIENAAGGNDPAFLLRTVIDEAPTCPPARQLYYSAIIRLADLALEAGVPPSEALLEARAALSSDVGEDAYGAGLRMRHLERLLARLGAEEHESVEALEWARLIDRYASHADPQVRATMLEHVNARGGSLDELTARDVRLLQYAENATRSDTAPETAVSRFRLSASIVEVIGLPAGGPLDGDTAPQRDAALAVKLSEDLERRFSDGADDPDLRALLARLILDRALRLSDNGHSTQALSLLSGFRARFGTSLGDPLRHLVAQAQYWKGRVLREQGHHAQARSAVESIVTEFSSDPDPDVRVWAANALFSAWRSPVLNAAEVAVTLERFAEAFSRDTDVRIRRHDASRRLSQAARAHEEGANDRAVRTLEELVAMFVTDHDEDIASTVRLAKENLTVHALTSGTTVSTGPEARYQALRKRLYTADELYNAGRPEDAVREWLGLTDLVSENEEPNFQILGLVALDTWGGYLEDSQRWAELAGVAHKVMVANGQLNFQTERIRARAYLRFGLAQWKLGDPHAAIAAYEALDSLVVAGSDDEVLTTRQQAVYNRAVLIDDIGDALAAVAAYDHVIAVHSATNQSRSRRLRCVKALRNKALLLDDLGRIAEAAGAHRQILDIVSKTPDEDLNERARLSAFALADCFTRLGDPAAAAQAYVWVRSAKNMGFTNTDVRTAARAQKAAERESRRHKKANR